VVIRSRRFFLFSRVRSATSLLRPLLPTSAFLCLSFFRMLLEIYLPGLLIKSWFCYPLLPFVGLGLFLDGNFVLYPIFFSFLARNGAAVVCSGHVLTDFLWLDFLTKELHALSFPFVELYKCLLMVSFSVIRSRGLNRRHPYESMDPVLLKAPILARIEDPFLWL